MSRELKRLHIFVGGMPQLLRDLVEEIVQSQPDMEIVCRDWRGDVAAVLEQRHAEVAIVHDTADNQVAGGRLVIVTYSERDGGAFSVRPLSIAELSPQALVQAIREAWAEC